MKPFDYEKVSLEEARKVLDEDIGDPAAQQSWTDKRQGAHEATLLDATTRWLAHLPDAARPAELAQRYPRIANELCRLWKQPAQWERYMTELLIVRSAGRQRQGFPAQVASELAALAAHHARVYPAAPQAGPRHRR